MARDPDMNPWADDIFSQRPDRLAPDTNRVRYEEIIRASRRQFDIDYLKGANTFKGEVLYVYDGSESRLEIAHADMALQVDVASSLDAVAALNASKYVRVRVRIPRIHDGIPEPCDVGIDDATNRARIEQHPLFISSRKVNPDKMPQVGDTVVVSFERGPRDGIQQGGIYHGIYTTGPGAYTPTNPDQCQNLTSTMENRRTVQTVGEQREEYAPTSPPRSGLSPEDQPTVTPSEIINGARCYDQSDIPMKSNHRPFLNEAHPDFLPYIKLFLCRCWERGIKIQINSVYRNASDQQRVYNQWLARGRTGPRPTLGLSYHIFGMAFDFNPILSNGRMLNSSDPRTDWAEVGQIGEAIGLYWGANFNNNYDPIHFDFRNVFLPNQRQPHIEGALATGVTPNRYPIQA